MSGLLTKRLARIAPCISSGKQTSSALIYTGACLITGLKVVTDGSNDGKIVVYDNTEAGGKIADEVNVSGSERYGGIVFGKAPMLMENGIYVALTGTNAAFFVFYFSESASGLPDGFGVW